jgi:pullulanase/glycogen debranching enzyme
MSTVKQKGRDDSLWYKDAVIYELHVRAFRNTCTASMPASRRPRLTWASGGGSPCFWQTTAGKSS